MPDAQEPRKDTPLTSRAGRRLLEDAAAEAEARVRAAPTPEELAPDFPELEIQELLGTGGMGAVYRARQIALDRPVALKLLTLDPDRDPSFAERFQREARALARLSHPNIVTLYASGEASGRPYLLLELIEGTSLRRALRDEAFGPEEALAIVPEICDALQYAHEQGVVHRDIKPENLLLDREGRVHIADFGLAKLMGVAPVEISLTHSEQVMGTWHYMAPEQMVATRDVDHRADIYSLGVVFYEMLTGKLPVGHFPPPSRDRNLNSGLDAIVLRALENAPDERYQAASEVRTDVQRLGEGTGSEGVSGEPGDRPDPDPHGVVGQTAPQAEATGSRWKRIALALPTRMATAAVPLLMALGFGHSISGLMLACVVAAGAGALGVRTLGSRWRSPHPSDPPWGPWRRLDRALSVRILDSVALLLLLGAVVESLETTHVGYAPGGPAQPVHSSDMKPEAWQKLYSLVPSPNPERDVAYALESAELHGGLADVSSFTLLLLALAAHFAAGTIAFRGGDDWSRSLYRGGQRTGLWFTGNLLLVTALHGQGQLVHSGRLEPLRVELELDRGFEGVLGEIDERLEASEIDSMRRSKWRLVTVPQGETRARLAYLSIETVPWYARWGLGTAGFLRRRPRFSAEVFGNESHGTRILASAGMADPNRYEGLFFRLELEDLLEDLE